MSRAFELTGSATTARSTALRGAICIATPELSQDGSGDGSLDDLYRYALDAAQMDYSHVADHQMGIDEEYNWWLTQKSSDVYLMPQRFVTLFGYERSVPYPNGHRNIVWSERGRAVLKIGQQEVKGEKCQWADSVSLPQSH
jgi:hypothetical protein